MGSQPAPPLSNIWLSKYEPNKKHSAKHFQRYMDDIVRTIKDDLIENKLVVINSLHPKIKFTLEVERNKKIFILRYVCIERNNSNLSSTWYCKSTDTGLVLNFHAVAPKRYKRSVVQSFVFRIYRACNSWKSFQESLNKAKEVF